MGTGHSSLYDDARAIRKAERKEDEPRFEYYVMDTRPQIEINASRLDKRFKLNEDGYFCERGTGSGIGHRQFRGDDPIGDAREFCEALADGAKLSEVLPKARGAVFKHFDGTRVTIRELTSSPNSPAVDIGRSASEIVQKQKIHFIRRVP